MSDFPLRPFAGSGMPGATNSHPALAIDGKERAGLYFCAEQGILIRRSQEVPFEETPPEAKSRPDRKLGDEWVDWNGTVQQDDTRTPAVVFWGLAFLVSVVLGALAWCLAWLMAPRFQGLGWGAEAWWFGYAASAYLLAWLAVLSAGMAGIQAAGRPMRWLGGIQWMVAPAVLFGKLLGVSRDRVGHAFILAYNRLETLPALITDPLRLLLLVPRCLSRETMQALKSLQEKYGVSQVVAFGGTEARKAIAGARPQAIVAVACERDLLIGIKDIKGRIPVLSYCNHRPEGPCKNTTVELADIEQAVRAFLGIRTPTPRSMAGSR